MIGRGLSVCCFFRVMNQMGLDLIDLNDGFYF